MILTIGNINMDWICTVPKLPVPDEKINIKELNVYPGGAASNVAVSLARLGSEVVLFGHVGNDTEGHEALRALREEKVDTSRVILEQRLATGFVIVLVGEKGQSMKLRYRGANTALSPKDITPNLFKDIKLVYLASITLPLAQKVALLCEELGIRLSLDVCGELLKQPSKAIQKLLCNFSLVFMNEVVFEQTYNKPPSKNNIQAELDGRMEVLNVTLGVKGAITATPDEIFHTPSFRVKVVDTTGAGDAYAAGFMHYSLQRLPLREVVKRANACAAMQITQPGARAGLPTAPEVEAFIESHGDKGD